MIFSIVSEMFFFILSQQRILLISSPLQNTLKELWTMIHFLLPGITKPYSDFPVKAGTDQNQDYCHKLVIRLHRVRAKPPILLPFTPAVPECTFTVLCDCDIWSLWTVGDSTFHPEALQKGCRKTAAQKVWTYLEMPPVSQTEEPLWRYPDSTRVRCLHCRQFCIDWDLR